MRNLVFNFIFICILIGLSSGCAVKKNQIFPAQKKIYTAETIAQLLKPSVKLIKSPIKCNFEQNGNSNNLYGDIFWSNANLKLKLYSAMNYAKIEIECDSKNIHAEINGKKENEDLKNFDKQKILDFIELLIVQQSSYPEIEILSQDDFKTVCSLWNKKINIEIDNISGVIKKIYYQNISIFYEKFMYHNNIKIPLKVKIVSDDPENRFTAEIQFSKSKLYVE
ncbi:hypothetical protein KA977_05775 [Candidatus Dependentiae bacterium]|nr:hypothetical protein [Candidatus Dependentiae bacterium]